AVGYGLRARRVSPRPAVRVVARMMDPVSLQDGALHPPGARANGAHAGVHVHADLPALAVRIAEAAPAADVVVLDHYIVRARHQSDRVLLRSLEDEAAHDHKRCGDGDVAVTAIDGGAIAVVQHITRCAAAIADVEWLAR